MPKMTFTAEEKAAYKEKKKEEIAAMTADIEKGIQDVFTSDKYADYLRVMSKFTNYSLNNTLLIALQKPDASLVAAFGKWKELGRSVNKGEKGITIFAPVMHKTNQYIETEVPVTDKYGNKLYNDDGTEKTETITEPVKGISFKTVTVFDVSQTSGKPLPTIVDELEGDFDHDKMAAVLEGVRKAAGVPVEFEDMGADVKGYYDHAEKKIAIKTGMSDIQTLKTAFHEAAHSILHDSDLDTPVSKLSRDAKEVQAESVAYMVASRYGIDTSEYSFVYVASWAKDKELNELKEHLQEIHDAAKKICDKIDGELMKLQKRELSVDEIISDKELPNISKAEMLIYKREQDGIFISDEDKKRIFEMSESTNPDDFGSVADSIRKISGYPRIDVEPHFLVPEFEQKSYSVQEFNTVLKKANERWQSDDKNEGKTANLKLTIHLSDTEKYEKSLLIEENFNKLSDFLKYDDVSGIYEDLTSAILRTEDIVSSSTVTVGDEVITTTATDGEVKGHDISAKTTATHSLNVIGNTPYEELGEKSELHYLHIPLKSIDDIAKRLEQAEIRFSGLIGTKNCTITVNTADIDKYRAVLAEYQAEMSAKQNAEDKRDKYCFGERPENIDDPVKHIFNAHAAKLIASELAALGVKYAGINEDKNTAVIISSSDEHLFKQAVERAKSKVQKAPTEENYKIIPLVMSSYNEAKSNGSLNSFYASLNALKACDKYIRENIDDAFRNRNTAELCVELENRFGAEKALYVVGKALVDNDSVPKAFKSLIDHFEYNIKSFKPLAEISATMLKSIFNDLAERNKEVFEEKKPEPLKLNSYFNDKHLFPTTRKYLEDDYRGFPITKSENSSRNETYVKGYGWLSNEEYDKAHKKYGANFWKLEEKVNVSYIDDNGRIGQMDITPDEYAAFSDRTYSKENKERYESAKSKWEDIVSKSRTQKPVEYYAVSQLSEKRFAVSSIGDDGTTEHITGKLTRNEAVEAIKELYKQKEAIGIDVQLVHPQRLSEISIEIYKSRQEQKPEQFFKVFLNPIKNAPDDQTHFVQEYKKDGDRYRDTGVSKVGTLEQCQEYASNALTTKKEPVYGIYQLKENAENHSHSFAGTEELARAGIRIEFSRYEKKYEAPLCDVQKKDLPSTLNGIFEKFNLDRPSDFKGHSLSVSDVIVLDKQPYFVDSIGFKKIKNFLPEQKIEYLQEQFKNSLENKISEARNPEQIRAVIHEGQLLGLDIRLTDIHPDKIQEAEKPEEKDQTKVRAKKPKL